jgi:ATP adenylyltransferase
MERIWAPWRMEYIRDEKPAHCIFCLESDKVCDREILVLHRTPFSSIMLNRYPYSNGHLLVSPLRHVAALDGLAGEELQDLFELVRRSCAVLTAVAAPEGFNIGMNLGKAAGAGEADHLHVHIVPRWNGDTNFMSVIADVRVIPEALMAMYDTLLPHINSPV